MNEGSKWMYWKTHGGQKRKKKDDSAYLAPFFSEIKVLSCGILWAHRALWGGSGPPFTQEETHV